MIRTPAREPFVIGSMDRGFLLTLPLLLLPACGAEPEAEEEVDAAVVSNFLSRSDPPKDAVIERRIDVEQTANLLAKAPLDRSEDVARGLAER